MKNREFYLEAYSKENAPLSWTAYSVSFTPKQSGYVTLGLSATYVKDAKIHWIDYDKLEIIEILAISLIFVFIFSSLFII